MTENKSNSSQTPACAILHHKYSREDTRARNFFERAGREAVYVMARARRQYSMDYLGDIDPLSLVEGKLWSAEGMATSRGKLQNTLWENIFILFLFYFDGRFPRWGLQHKQLGDSFKYTATRAFGESYSAFSEY